MKFICENYKISKFIFHGHAACAHLTEDTSGYKMTWHSEMLTHGKSLRITYIWAERTPKLTINSKLRQINFLTLFICSLYVSICVSLRQTPLEVLTCGFYPTTMIS